MDILGLEKLTNEKWINLFAARFRHNDHSGRWVFASRKPDPNLGRDRADAVVIVPTLVKRGKRTHLVVIREFRIPVGGYVYGFPAGLLEAGESVEETARREIVEETGMELVKVKRVTPPLFSSSGLTDETAAMAFVDVRSTPTTKPRLEASEELEAVLWDLETVCRMCDAPDAAMDAKVWTVLFICQQLGRLV
jgi:ADP-ribose pyrophosphatase